MSSYFSTAAQKKGAVATSTVALVFLLQVVLKVWPRASPTGADDDCGGIGLAACAELRLFSAWHHTTPPLQSDGGQLQPTKLNGLFNASSNATVAKVDDFGLGLSFRTGGLSPRPIVAEVQADGRIIAEGSSQGSGPTPDKTEQSERDEEKLLRQRHAAPEGEGILRFFNATDEHDADSPVRQHDEAASDEDSLQQHDLPDSENGKDALHRSEESRSALYEEFDRQAEKVTRSLSGRGSLTPWGSQLQEVQSDLEARMAALPSQRRSKTEALASPAPVAPSPVRDTVLNEINDLLRQMCEDVRHRDSHVCKPLLESFAVAHIPVAMASPQERRRELDTELEVLAEEHAVWQQDFDAKVSDAHRELCEDPARHDRPDCIKFLSSISQSEGGKHRELHDAHQASLTVLRSNVSQEIKVRAAALERKLSDIVAERRSWEAELLKKYGLGEKVRHAHHDQHVHEKPRAEAAAATEDESLHWSAVESWPLNGRLRGSFQRRGDRVVLHRRDLLSTRWAGRIPKVACITAIKSGVAARIQLKYFVENFRKQRYEGASQLVLVYHRSDHEAGRLAASYADGSYITAVAAQSEEQEFPSTTDLRYGAWTAKDADVVAQWAFQEWHHFDRLSLQVRAMAFSARPACVFRAAEAENPPTPGLAASDDSLAGDANWMKEHWHPWLREQAAVLHSAQAFHIVELDMNTFGGHAVTTAAPASAGQPAHLDGVAEGAAGGGKVDA